MARIWKLYFDKYPGSRPSSDDLRTAYLALTDFDAFVQCSTELEAIRADKLTWDVIFGFGTTRERVPPRDAGDVSWARLLSTCLASPEQLFSRALSKVGLTSMSLIYDLDISTHRFPSDIQPFGAHSGLQALWRYLEFGRSLRKCHGSDFLFPKEMPLTFGWYSLAECQILSRDLAALGDLPDELTMVPKAGTQNDRAWKVYPESAVRILREAAEAACKRQCGLVFTAM